LTGALLAPLGAPPALEPLLPRGALTALEPLTSVVRSVGVPKLNRLDGRGIGGLQQQGHHSNGRGPYRATRREQRDDPASHERPAGERALMVVAVFPGHARATVHWRDEPAMNPT
jgi:hypothetical protein